MNKWLRLFLLISFLFVGLYIYQKYRIPPSLVFNGIRARSISGETFSPDKEKRKLYIFQFFATWCIDCRRELPIWKSMQGFMDKENIGLYLLSDETMEVLASFVPSTAGIPMFQLNQSFKDYSIYTLPTVFIFNSEGEKVFAKSGNWEPDTTDLKNFIHARAEM